MHYFFGETGHSFKETQNEKHFPVRRSVRRRQELWVPATPVQKELHQSGGVQGANARFHTISAHLTAPIAHYNSNHVLADFSVRKSFMAQRHHHGIWHPIG